MSERAKRVLTVCSREACQDIFSRAPCDLKRAKRPYCCRRCFELDLAVGRSTVTGTCAGCGAAVQRVSSESLRRKAFYCSMACYRANADFEALGRAGGSTPRAPLAREVLVARGRAGGLARARALSADRLREISRLGVEARLARQAEVEAKARATRRAGGEVLLGVRLGRRQC